MAGATVAATKFPVTVTAAHDGTVTLTVVDDNAAPYAWSGKTVTAAILGHATVTEWSVSTPSAGTLILTLTDTQTTDLGVGAFGWALSVTTGTDKAPWLAGQLTVLPEGTPAPTTATTATVTVQAGATATVTAGDSSTIVAAHLADATDAHDASAISVLDTANNFVAADVEGVLAELPARYAKAIIVDRAFSGGVIDATAHIQAKIDEAIAAKLPLVFDGGTYKITDTLAITSSIEVFGVFSHTLINCVGTDVGLLVTADAYVRVEGLRFTGSAGAIDGIVSAKAPGGTPFQHHFVRCRAVSFARYGFAQLNGEVFLWDHCYAYACGTGFYADQSANTVSGFGVNNEWRQCRAQLCTDIGFDIKTQIGPRLIGCEGLDNANYQMYLGGDTFGGKIEGFDAEVTSGGPSTTGVLLSGSRHIVSGMLGNNLETAILTANASLCEFHTTRFVGCTNGIIQSNATNTNNVVYDPVVAVFDPNANSRNIRLVTWGARTIRKPADQTVNNSVTRIADDTFAFAINASETWVGEIVLFVAGSTAADFKYALSVPSGATLIHAAQASRTTDALITATEIVTVSDTPIANVGVNAAGSLIIVKFTVVNGVTAGNVTMNWAQGVATAADTTIKANSYMTIQRLA